MKIFLLLSFFSLYALINSNECKSLRSQTGAKDIQKNTIACECIKFKTFSQIVRN